MCSYLLVPYTDQTQPGGSSSVSRMQFDQVVLITWGPCKAEMNWAPEWLTHVADN